MFSAFCSCKKKGAFINSNVINTPVSSSIFKSYWFNKNIGIFCGGEKGKNGYIFKTVDGGNTWMESYRNSNKSLFDVFFVNDSVGYCCGEGMTLLKTQNKGNNWQEIDLKNSYSYDDFYNGSLHGIIGNESNLIIVGGKNFNVGIIVRIANNNIIEGYKGFDNEFRCGFNFNNYIACGYGTSYRTEDDGKNYHPTNFKGDFLTSCITLNSSTGFACGYDGNVYKTSNAGDSYSKIFDHNRFYKKHVNFNGINFIHETKGWVVGNKGFAYQTNNGKKFDKINLNTSADLYSIVSNKNNEVVVSTSNGKLIVFSY